MVDSGRLWGKVGDNMFMGEYHHSIDEKNRIVIPNKFRGELGERFIITRGIEKCLYIYSEKEWQKIVDKLNELPFTKKDARTFIRSFFSGASFCELDKQGRINIAGPLVKYSNLVKDCVVIGANDRVEIWSQDEWDNFFLDNGSKLEDIAENLFTNVGV